MRRIRPIRGLGFFDSVMLGIGFIIGSGIFLMPILAAKEAGSYSLIAWLLAGLYSLLTAFCFAEAATKIPKAGGLYAYAHEAFGDFTGFLTGWTFWLGYWITIATEMWAIAWYLGFFFPSPDLIRLMIAFLIGLVLTLINFKGVRLGAEADDFFTISKLIPLLLFAFVGLFFVSGSNYIPALPEGKEVLPAIFSATILVLWAFNGSEIITVPEDEIKNARKTVPKAIFVSALTVISLYLLISAVALGVDRWEKYSNSQFPIAEISEVFLGKTGGIVLAVGGLVSIIGALNAVILASARISFAMSRDKLFPKSFSILHKRSKTPYVGLIFQFALASILIFLIQDFTILATLAVFFTVIPYFFSCLATYKLVKIARGELNILKTKFIPILAAVISLFLLTQFSTRLLPIGASFILIGIAIFAVRKKMKSL